MCPVTQVCAGVSRRAGVDVSTDAYSSGTEALQRRVIRLLGTLGGVNKAVVGTVDNHLTRSLAWDTVQRLNIGLPLGGTRQSRFELT